MARLLHSHICAHLGSQIEFTTFLNAEGYPDLETAVGRDGYPCDSLSLLSLCTQLSQVFHLNQLGLEDSLLRKPDLGKWTDLILSGWESGIRQMTFFTSGSTQQQRPMCHTFETLNQEAAYLAEILKGSKRIIAMVPAHHIYGFLFTVLLPCHLKIPVIEARHLGPAALRQLLEEGDLLISHPFQWGFLVKAWPDVAAITGVTSTAPCPAETHHQLMRLGMKRFVEVYGSSETGGLGWREAADASFHRFPYWHAATSEEDPSLARQMPDGSLQEVEAPDRLLWEGPDMFRVLGRRDGAVQVGGHNVYPNSIAQIMMEHPDVADCQVRLMRPHEGNRLKAFVVPTPEAAIEDLKVRLHRWCEAELRPPQRPAHITLGSRLPTNTMGKAADWAMEEDAST